MVDEQGNFRRKLMGGFDQEDVISYIEELSFQRNKYQLEAVQRSNEAGSLKAQIDALSRLAEDRDAELARVNQELSGCRAELEELRREFAVTQDELSAVKNRLDRTTRELSDANASAAAERSAAKAANRRLFDGTAAIIDDLQRRYDSERAGIEGAVEKLTERVGGLFDSPSGVGTALEAAKEKLDSLRQSSEID